MKRSTAAWAVTVTAAALLALPPAVAAQSTPPTPAAQTATQPPATTAPSSQGTAQEHLKEARAALNDITTTTLSARAKTQISELKRRLTVLERDSSATSKTWGNEVAAMDKILTTLLASDATPTGTAGAKGKAAATVAIDDATRTKLTAVRTALTAYAASKSGQPSPSSDAPPAATSATPPSEPATSATPPTSTPPTSTPAEPAAQAPATPPAQKVDEEAAKRALTEARNTLSALTQLPAAAQLSGDARTQVTQLISNFNELITTKTEWRASYAKVAANLTALLGPDTGTTDPSSASGTAGAVGTSGSGIPNLDPGIRTKLVELRKNLADFERASGGSSAGGVTPAASSATPTTTPSTATPPSGAPSTTPPAAATPPAATTPPATTPSAAPPETPAASPATIQAESMRLIAAIESMLKMQNEGGGLTLDKTQADMLRAHVADLKKLLEKK